MKIKLYILIFWQSTAAALPDVPSFSSCPDIIHHSGFQNQSQPSLGFGGNYPGSFTNQININGTQRTYFSYIPSQYNPNKAWPLLIVLHGAASAGQTQQAAEAMKNFWQNAAESYQMILVAPVATGSQSWVVPEPSKSLWNDIVSEVEDNYNIEMSRHYGWGFSAGGHVGHWYFLDNSEYYAAYAVNAGVLEAYATLNAPANATRKIPVLEMVGTNDTLYSYTLNDQNAFINAGWQQDKNYKLETFSGGHVLNNNVPETVLNYLCDKSIYN